MSLFDPPAESCPTCGRPLGDLHGGGVPGRARTSRAAAAIERGTDRFAVLDVLAERGPLTADAVAEAVAKSPNQTAARLLELRDGGYVGFVIMGDKRAKAATRSGSLAYLQRITAMGLAVLSSASR